MFEKQGQPALGYNLGPEARTRPRWQSTWAVFLLAGFLVLLSTLLYKPVAVVAPLNAGAILEECQFLKAKPGPPPDFHSREVSDRFEKGTKPTLIQNATIWTGGRMGTEVVYGDILLDGGIVRALGYIPPKLINEYSPASLNFIDANGGWITPGLFDLHSHMGVLSAPLLTGALDVNSPNGDVTPWARTVDALNVRDDAYRLTVSGGVTGGLILPGSGQSIGGQAFPIKYRRTSERSPTSMIIEFPFGSNSSSKSDPSKPLRWRHMKHATGENSMRFGTRMDSTWAFRRAYDQARRIKNAQDSFCAKAEKGLWNDPELKGKDFPFELQWEALVDVLRGRVKVNSHTYETEDLDFLSRLTNEFKFRLAGLHHAHETYLVPEVLKRMYGGPPTVAMFALNARYKRESYRGSEFAARILADNGIDVVLKSDHPVINSRHLIFEAQQAHFYSLRANLALRAVTSAPAEAAGLGHRIGSLSPGYDADVVIWDSHPLALGATPRQVYIDGIPQLEHPHVLAEKPEPFQRVPWAPSWDQEVKETLKWDGLPPLRPRKRSSNVVFLNVNTIWQRDGSRVVKTFGAKQHTSLQQNTTVVVSNGRIECFGASGECARAAMDHTYDYEVIDLQGGSITLALTTFGSPLGLSEIASEPSTSEDGRFNPLSELLPPIIADSAGAIEAVDGLSFNGRDTLYAYRFGVTTAISAWDSYPGWIGGGGTFDGTSVAFRTGALHGLEERAIIKPTTAMHVSIKHGLIRGAGSPSVGTQIAALRAALEGTAKGKTGHLFSQVVAGKLPLVVSVDNADIMVTLIKLKREIEGSTGIGLQMVFHGAVESHLIADEIAAAGISVIVNPVHPYPKVWESRRILPGPPLTKHTTITALLAKNVTVAIGVHENWEARNALLNVAQAALAADGMMEEEDALALASTNLHRIFGIGDPDASMDDLVAYQGGDIFNFESKVVAIISPRLGGVDIF